MNMKKISFAEKTFSN